MKKILLLALVAVAGLSQKAIAQDELPYDTAQKKIIWSEVVKVPGATKDQLYDRAYKLLHQMYQQADSKLAVKDKANGKIVLNGFVRVIFHEKDGTNVPDPDLIKYKLTILFKDGKYKYEITDFVINRGGIPFHIERWREHNKEGDHTFGPEDRIVEKLQFVHDDIGKVIDRLKRDMAADKVEEKKDW